MVGKCWWPECSWGYNDVRAFLTSSLVFLPQRECQMILCQCNKPRIPATILNVGNLLKNDSFQIRKFCWQRGKQTLPFANAWEISCVSCGQLLLFSQDFQLIQRHLPKGNNCQEGRILRNDMMKSCFWNVYSFTISAICFIVPSFIFERYASGLLEAQIGIS